MGSSASPRRRTGALARATARRSSASASGGACGPARRRRAAAHRCRPGVGAGLISLLNIKRTPVIYPKTLSEVNFSTICVDDGVLLELVVPVIHTSPGPCRTVGALNVHAK